MSDPTRGITCPDMRRVVREALANGWEWGGFTGSTHCRIRWPKTGDMVTFGTTPSVASWKSLATDIKRISGVQTWRKGNRKRSRKAVHPSGFSLDRAAMEQRRRNAASKEALDQRDDLIDQCRTIATSPDPSRDDARRFLKLLDRIRGIENFHGLEPWDARELTL